MAEAGLTANEDNVAVVTESVDVLDFPPKAAVIIEVPLATAVANPVDAPMVATLVVPDDQTVNLLTSRVDPSL